MARSVKAWLCTEEEPRVEVYWCGEDEMHGGRCRDHIVGNLRSEHHFGGRGDDLLVDTDSRKNPDVFRCGPDVDRVHYNKGLDKVANDCEDLRPYNRY